MKCKKCKRDLKFPKHLKGTAIEQQKICMYCGCKNEEKFNPKQKPAFKDALKMQLENMGKASDKILKDAFAPIDKLDQDLKRIGLG